MCPSVLVTCVLQCIDVRGGVVCALQRVGCDGVRTVVVGDHVQAVEQLSLVLVDPLHLDVKHGVGVDLHLVVLLQVDGELQLVFLRRQEEAKKSTSH